MDRALMEVFIGSGRTSNSTRVKYGNNLFIETETCRFVGQYSVNLLEWLELGLVVVAYLSVGDSNLTVYLLL